MAFDHPLAQLEADLTILPPGITEVSLWQHHWPYSYSSWQHPKPPSLTKRGLENPSYLNHLRQTNMAEMFTMILVSVS